MRRDGHPTEKRGRSATGALDRVRVTISGLRGRRRAAALTGAGLLVSALVVWAVLAFTGPEPRARQYLNFKACLLTDSQGIIGEQAARAWSGMQKASLETRARVQYLPVFGPPTAANAAPYLTSLIQRKCDLVIAAGDVASAAVAQNAERFPRTTFIVIGAGSPGSNTRIVNPAQVDVPGAIAEMIEKSVDDSGE